MTITHYVPALIKTSAKFADSAAIDSFARLRISQPETLFDSKQIFDNAPLFWDDSEVSGSGTSSTHSVDAARTRISVGATTAGKRVRQTFMRFNYQPGKSQLAILTGVLGTGASGITQEIGMFDDENGVFFRCEDGTLKVVCKSNVTGSAVDTEVSQTSWNLDTMDGNGNSGVTLDLTKTQIFFFDFEWLGVGRVRAGFFVDGVPIYCHQFLNANVLDVVYMSTPNLPLRYSIENDGTGVASDVDHICSTVISEGGSQDLGLLRSKENGGLASLSSGTSYALLGIRLQTAKAGATVKMVAQSLLATSANDTVRWALILNGTIAGSPSWANETDSAVQTFVGTTSETVSGGTRITGGFFSTSSPISSALENAIRIGVAIDGTTLDTITLVVTPITNNITVHGSITWRELS